MSFSVINLKNDEICIVCTKWIFKNGKKIMCHYPKLDSKFDVGKFIVAEKEPAETWCQYELKKVICKTGNYLFACFFY